MLLAKPQYSYKQASISSIVNNGPQMLIASVLLALLEELDHPFSKSLDSTNYVTKRKYSNKQVSISCFLSHGPQMLIASVLMVLFEHLDHDCDPRYLKPTILAFQVLPGKLKMTNFGYFAIITKIVGSG